MKGISLTTRRVLIPLLLAAVLLSSCLRNEPVAVSGRKNHAPSPSAEEPGRSSPIGCPQTLSAGRGAHKGVVAVIGPEVRRAFHEVDLTDFSVTALTSLDRAAFVPRFRLDHFRRRASRECGETAATRSWAAFLSLPAAPFANAGIAVAYFVRTNEGWCLWFRYYPNIAGSGSRTRC